MADDVPVADVLCEAMEYLAKLGSNLRARSDILKEKKIRKDKLKNAHAVLKAAQKVLSICELSKKSLDNVETGVKKIMAVVDAGQATSGDGGKTVKRDKTDKTTSNTTHSRPNKDSSKVIVFPWGKQALKIKQKVNLKHYQSVKVLARPMSKSMIEKYPVYYSCRLYRIRERMARRDTSASRHSVDSKASSRAYKECKDKNMHPDKASSLQTDTDCKDTDKEKEKKKKKDDGEKVSLFTESSTKHKRKQSTDISLAPDSHKKKNTEKENKIESSTINVGSSEDETPKSPKKQKTKKLKRVRIIDDSSGSEKEANIKTTGLGDVKIVSLEIEDDDLENTPISTAKSPSEDPNEQSFRNKPSDEPVRDILDKDISRDESLQNKLGNEHSNDKTEKPNGTQADCEINENVEDGLNYEPVKPLIKCVSIAKLLKPDVLHKEPKSTNELKSKDVIVRMNRKGELEAKPLKNIQNSTTKHRSIKKITMDAEKVKQRMVKAFRPKKFSINIVKLPPLTSEFLLENNLRRITQNGLVVCKVTNNNESPDDAKKALLNDSDTERSETSPIKSRLPSSNVINAKESSHDAEKTNNAKKALLNDSDTEKSGTSPITSRLPSSSDLNEKESLNDAESTNNAKKALLNDSDSEKSETSPITSRLPSSSDINEKESLNDAESTNDAKKALLNDSDSEKSETSPNKSRLASSGEINETEKEKIKNALLNDSESEKSEEENHQRKQPTTIPIKKKLKEKDSEIQDDRSSDIDATDETQQAESNSLNAEAAEEDKIPSDEHNEELAKSSLLNDSSSSSSKTPEKQKKYNKTVKSRKKRIRESMQAKKMLLSNSSSSDTEDEKLTNGAKSVKKKKHSSSDSDESSIKHDKKRRKVSRSPSAEAQAEASSHSDKSGQSEEDSSSNSSEKSKTSHTKMGRSKERPGSSNSQNSVAQEDKDIEGLTNLKSLTKRRRRGSVSDKAESVSTRSSSRSAKKETMATKHITGEEGLVEAHVSSDDASEASDGPEEDLPPIALTSGLNGGALDHLAKDDLLEESESDSSNDNNMETKKETDSDSDNLKSKRRKANTISSDSEAGSSRRKEKDQDARISDFEDSEDDTLEPVKRSKRKKKSSDSDASAGSSTEEGKKKRRRIKQIDSDASGSDSENEGKNKHGRKNIRKVMGKNQLEEATKKAAREEKERLARIIERQRMYNNLEFDESGKPDEVILDKVVLDFDPETKEPLIEVDRGLVKKLKPHQANGIKFMWDACFESVKRIKKDKGSGCILAHCMGLGKTLQVVSLTHTLLIHSDLTKVNRVLVVCPLSTVLNWVNEFKMWLKYADTDYEVDVYELSKFKQNSERAYQLSSWFAHGGVCVLGYEMFRNLSADNPKKFKKKMLRQFQESLVDPGPDLVVCDEGHLLKNEKTSLSQSMNRVKTRRRIVLTGTPLQNNLKEYYCMVQFVKPNLLGKYNEYLNRFVNPITNGQYTDSTEHDIKIMKRRSHVLHKMLDGAVQRRDYGVLAPFLPPKHEYVLFITLTDVQAKLYQHYLDNYSRRPLAGKSSGFLFPDFQSLQRIWTHPLVLKYNSERYEIMQQKKREREEEEDSEGSLVDFIDDDSTPDETSSEDMSDSLSDASDDSRKKTKKKKSSKKHKKASTRRGTRANPVELDPEVEPDPDPDVIEVKNDNPTEWWIPLVTDDEIEDMRNSHKLVLLFEILRQCEAIGDKLLVFSQSLYSLDLIEHFLGKVDEATQEGRIDEKLGGHVGSWSPGIDYFRLDGSTSCENRSIWCKNFNREDNPRARLFLISTRAGGLGINLVAANRVVIFDVSWNPSHDVQSIFRVYRFGQKKPCYVYRFLAMGTMEEKIYERQVTKQAISKRVIDEQQIDRHYAENDLAELYKFEPRPPEPRPVPLVPKDRLFAEMIKEREHVIYKFHEHDSLLENKEEETLSEEERKAAWEDFENEKNRPPPQPFSAWPMHNGMPGLPNLLAQQQQQLAYAALAQMLRKDMPGLTDDNIRSMLPLIYSSNPTMFGGYDYGLMQKLSNMYAQPGMMNPAMMNPGMNVGGAQPGMGGSGTSGLQYEPPWQRQQQQQQQMRLQQLMQQQNQMGAKFYAGGLGSRDPVAMALQQQRAREIMLGNAGGGGGGGGVAGAAGRPRGRPPLSPRATPFPAPTAAPGDVVNLDSD